MALGYEGYFTVEARGKSGGMVMMWKEKEDAQVIGFSVNHIDVIVRLSDMEEWRLTGIYGEPNRSLRGGNPYPNTLIEGFNKAVSDCNLVDLDLIGHQFTWEKSRGTARWIEVRLDRAMVDSRWQAIFQLAQLFNLEVTISDHNPIFLNPTAEVRYAPKRRFRFENAWLTDPMCFELVQNNWQKDGSMAIQNKLEGCKEVLEEWGMGLTGNFKKRINDCKQVLRRMRGKRDDSSVKCYKEAQSKLAEVYYQKEIYWRQRSKQLWLQFGDLNTKYFHASATTRRKNNLIAKLQNENGIWVDKGSGLHEVMEDYFRNIFSTTGVELEEIMREIPNRITENHNKWLLEVVRPEEVKEALFSMNPNKAPGLDGFTPGFYQKCWSIIGKDVVETVKKFFTVGKLPEKLNDTLLVLIPKKKNPRVMADLRPIALCNLLYKIIGKVLANRLKRFLHLVVSENQSAFLKGRLILDNVMISFEVLHYLKRKQQGKAGYMALKLDLSKAYDRVEWQYLRAIMKQMGFCERWINLIIECVTTVEYSITHGGEVFGQIRPTRGIRQGDPLSPYLFILCAEGLSSLISSYERRKLIHGCKVARGAPVITHMLFADDSYIYCRASLEEANRVMELLRTFKVAAGQKINLDKSSVFFSKNTRSSVKEEVLDSLGMQMADERSHYLGLPSLIGRNKNVVFGYIKDKMRTRIQSWGGVCSEIESLISNYWWSSSKKDNGIHWLNWDCLSDHKNKGGMGFKKIRDFNLAMLGRQGWRLLAFENSLVGRVFKAKYYPNSNFLEAKMGSNPSYVWRSVLEAQVLIRRGARWRVGDGSNIGILAQPWLPDRQNPVITTRHPALEGTMVKNLMRVDNRDWDIDIVEDLFEDRDKRLIYSIQLKGKCSKDSWTCWSLVCPEFTYNDSFNFNTWFEYVMEQLAHKVGFISTVCWGIWRARNDVVWNEKITRAAQVVSIAKAYLTQWKNVRTIGGSTPAKQVSITGIIERWAKPRENGVKINCDASLFGNSGRYGIGWIARDDNGKLIYASSLTFAGTPEIHWAEAIGVREALSWIKAEEARRMEAGNSQQRKYTVESDCQVVVKAIQSREEILSPFGNTIEECREIVDELNNIDIVFVKRSGNRAADWLARSDPGCIFRGGYVPAELQSILVTDLQ
ncbi:hypothetical protein AgCh_032729 [Apium graveolens]